MCCRFTEIICLIFLAVFTSAQNLHLLHENQGRSNNEQAVYQKKTGASERAGQESTVKNDKINTAGTVITGNLRPVSEGEVVQHNWYTLSYSEENEQAIWVYYKLTDEMLKGTASRTDDFRADNFVSTLSAHPDDYAGCGFDRGHLCPSADMTINRSAMSESFYMSNMSPQVPAFNRGIWKKLEAVVRNWAIAEKEIHVVTGPVFNNNLGVLPNCNVTIPGYFYKVILDPTGESKMIALVLPNGRGEKHLSEYVVTVNYVETLTGIDFFESLPDSLEDRLESDSNPSLWNFTEYKGSASEADSSTQCEGISKSTGKRCRNKTTSSNGYCHLHQSQVQPRQK